MNLTRLTTNPAIAQAGADIQQSKPRRLVQNPASMSSSLTNRRMHVWIRLIRDSRC